MSDDHLRFRCYRCNQLLGVSSRRAGTVTSCPKCAAEQLPWGPAITRLTAAEAARLALDSVDLAVPHNAQNPNGSV